MKYQDMPYERVDFDWVEKEFNGLKQDFAAAKSGEEQFAVHERYYALRDRVDTMMTLAQTRHDGNTADEFYSGEQDYYDEMSPRYSNMVIEYQKLLYDSPYREVLEEKIGPVAFKNMELSRKSMQEKLIPLVQEENALATSYEKLLAGAKIDWDGETLNLSLLTPYLTSADPAVRRKAAEKQNAISTPFISGKNRDGGLGPAPQIIANSERGGRKSAAVMSSRAMFFAPLAKGIVMMNTRPACAQAHLSFPATQPSP